MKKLLIPIVALFFFISGALVARKYGDYASLSIMAAINAARDWVNAGGEIPLP